MDSHECSIGLPMEHLDRFWNVNGVDNEQQNIAGGPLLLAEDHASLDL